MESEIERFLLHSNYRIDLRARIKNDLMVILRIFPGLRLGLKTITDHNEIFKVCCLEGILPIIYQNATYNIPISCIIPPRYPNSTPGVYVINPPGTYIQPSSFIEPDGFVKHPTLLLWDPKKSSLSKALYDIIAGFSQQFPIASGVPPERTIYPKLNTPTEEKKYFRPDLNNSNHLVYFKIEEQEREIEGNIEKLLNDTSTPQDPISYFRDLKQLYYELFKTNRKKEKSMIILSKLS